MTGTALNRSVEVAVAFLGPVLEDVDFHVSSQPLADANISDQYQLSLIIKNKHDNVNLLFS